jgi:tripartite-type tricarboxylate transporter receptor subunit TctC
MPPASRCSEPRGNLREDTVTRKLIAIVLTVLAGIGAARAQVYPARPVTIIVPFTAGGATDVMARILAEPMRAALGQPVVIENVAGAAGTIGVARAVRSPPDGYTLSIGTSTTHMLTGALYALPFDLLTDLEPVLQIAAEPLLIATRKTLPVNDLAGLIAWLKANPDKASAGIPGVGSTGHVTGLFLQKQTGTRYQFVPYRGNGPALQDLVAGQIDLMTEPVSNFLQQVRAGTIKALAVTGASRLAGAPDIPTVDEAGLPGLHASLWYGLWAPKGTPKDIIAKVNGVLVEALATPALRARLAELGDEIPPRERQTPEALAAFQKTEIEKWWPVVKAAGIKLQ